MTYNVTEQNNLDQKLPPNPPKWDQKVVDELSLDAKLRYLYSNGDEMWSPGNPDEEWAFESWKAKRLAAARKMEEQD